MAMHACARRYAAVEYPTPVVEEYDAQSAENEVLKEMPSLRCVLSGQRLWGAVTAEDGYSYDCDALQKYIKANGKKKAGSIDIIAPSPILSGLSENTHNRPCTAASIVARRAIQHGTDCVGALQQAEACCAQHCAWAERA